MLDLTAVENLPFDAHFLERNLNRLSIKEHLISDVCHSESTISVQRNTSHSGNTKLIPSNDFIFKIKLIWVALKRSLGVR